MGALSLLQPSRTNPPPLRRLYSAPAAISAHVQHQENTKSLSMLEEKLCRVDMMMNKECLFSPPFGESWARKNDQSFFCLFLPDGLGGGQKPKGTVGKKLLETLPLPSCKRSISFHRHSSRSKPVSQTWPMCGSEFQNRLYVWWKNRCLNKNLPKVQLKKPPNFAQSLFSPRHSNTNGTSRPGLIYPVIIWHFLLPSLSSLCCRMISETMLDLAADLRRFYCSWLTNTPIVIQLLSAGLFKLTEHKRKDFSDGYYWILGIRN